MDVKRTGSFMESHAMKKKKKKKMALLLLRWLSYPMLHKGVKNIAKLSETLKDFWPDFNHKKMFQNRYYLRISGTVTEEFSFLQ